MAVSARAYGIVSEIQAAEFTPPALELSAINKAFGSVRALDSACLTAPRGQIVAVLGENGAGKTTLMRVAFGLVRADSGQVRVDGKLVDSPSPSGSARLGIGMVHQHFTLIPSMSAAENVALCRRGLFDERAIAAEMEVIAQKTGLRLDPHALAGELSAGAQQRLEIVKALARGARTLILDEPTAVLTLDQSRELMSFLRKFVEEGGAAVLITHKLREALEVADGVCVMRSGRTVLQLSREAAHEELVIGAMLGEHAPAAERRELEGTTMGEERVSLGPAPAPEPPAGAARTSLLAVESAAQTPVPASASARVGVASGSAVAQGHLYADPVVIARDLVVEDERGVAMVNEVSFTLRRGELVGLAGAEGSGHRWLIRAVAGRVKPGRGELTLPHKIGFVPEDRHRDAMVADWSLVENIALAGAERRTGRIAWRQLRDTTKALIQDFDVRTDSADVAAGTLSGGNQQKLVLARELSALPDLLVAEQPTRGLDIAATAAVHQRLVGAREAGAAVLVSSADLEELVALSDRVLVMFGGGIVEAERDVGAVGRAMIGIA